MKYLSIEPLKAALMRVNQSTQEHRTGTVASGLLNNYYPKESYIITPEQIQEISNKKTGFFSWKTTQQGACTSYICRNKKFSKFQF